MFPQYFSKNVHIEVSEVKVPYINHPFYDTFYQKKHLWNRDGGHQTHAHGQRKEGDVSGGWGFR